jgi:hypothetical protein
MRRRRFLPPRKGSAYRGLAHTIGPREIGLRSAFRESLNGFLALMRGRVPCALKTVAPTQSPEGEVAIPTAYLWRRRHHIAMR